MYTFAIVALLALATLKLADYLSDNVGSLDKVKGLLVFAAAIGGVYAIDFSMFEGWNTAVREDWLGTLVTGFAVAGMTVPWRAVFGYLTHDRAEVDETLRKHEPIRRAA